MWVSDGTVGLLEKRLLAVSSLDLDHSASVVGSVWERGADNELTLEDYLAYHRNNANDPASDNLAIAHSVGFNMDRVRSLESAMTLNDFAHVALDGYHPPGTGSGDVDLNKHTMKSSGAILKGSPVYVLSSNTVDSANADPGAPVPLYLQCYPVGFANSSTGGSNQDIEILTEGHVELADWTGITGTTNLQVGLFYFLASTEGKITHIAPTTDGHVVIRLGRALTTKKLDIEIGEGVVL